VVLRRTNYGEADRILQLITPDGRKSVMARSVRKEKSRLAGGIELFAISDVVLREGKGELGILTSARLVYFFRHILEDYDRLQFGYEAIKQVSRGSESFDKGTGGTLSGKDPVHVPPFSIDTNPSKSP
jgi:DNA repair protein RecO (recombination protein O)